MSLRNPLTGHRIKYMGPTHRKLLELTYDIDEILSNPNPVQIPIMPRQTGGDPLKGKTAQKGAKEAKSFFENLLKKSQQLETIAPQNGKANSGSDNVVIPKNKYALMSSVLPPNPEQHSWYHHHSPFAQNFGDYVCLKRSTLSELGTFLHDSMNSDVAPMGKI